MLTIIDRTRFLSRLKRHARLSAFLIVCFFPVTASAQMPEIVWDTIYSTNTFDFAARIIRIENGYAVIGSKDQHQLNSAFSGDYFVTTYDENGHQLSQWSYGGFNNDEGIDLMQTADGGYILIGHSFSSDTDVSNHHHSPNGARSDAWVVKINSTGQIEWERSLGGSGNDGGFDIKVLSDGSYLAAGKAKSTNGDVSTPLGGDDAWVVHLAQDGTILWEKTYGGSNDDLIWDMQVTDDDGFIFIGHTFSSDGDLLNLPVQSYNDAWLVKCNEIGEIEWQRLLGNPDYYDYGRGVRKTDDGYIAAYMRYTGAGTGASTINVVKLDLNGEIIWTYQGEGLAGYTAPADLTFTENGNILMCGSFSDGVTSYMMLTQISGETGELAWTYNVPEMITPYATSKSVAYSISSLVDDEFVVVGHTYRAGTANPQMDARITKFVMNEEIISVKDNQQKELLVFPNPAKDILSFSANATNDWSIIDITGRIVHSGKTFHSGIQSIDIAKLPQGMYLLSLEQDGNQSQQQFIKQ